MADFTLSWAITGSANNGLQTIQYRHYGDSAWTTYSTEAAGVITKTVIGLDDNTVYEFRIVNNCTTGVTSPSNLLEQVDKVCPTFKSLGSSFCGSIAAAVEAFASPDIVDYTINLYQLGNPTPIASYTETTPVGDGEVSYTFTNLTGNTTYQANIVIHIQGSVLYTVTCPKTNITTAVAEPCDPITDLTAELGPGLLPGDVDLTLTWTPPSPVPANGYIVYYRRVGSSTYLQQIIGDTESSIVLSSITPGYDYEGYIVAVCTSCCDLPGCENLSVQVPFQTESNNVRVINSQSDGLEFVTVLTTAGTPLFTGDVADISYVDPVLYGQTVTGGHVGFTDTLYFEIRGTNTFDAKINILKNNVLVECITIPVGTYTPAGLPVTSLVVTTYAITDEITIVLENTGCGIVP